MGAGPGAWPHCPHSQCSRQLGASGLRAEGPRLGDTKGPGRPEVGETSSTAGTRGPAHCLVWESGPRPSVHVLALLCGVGAEPAPGKVTGLGGWGGDRLTWAPGPERRAPQDRPQAHHSWAPL